LVSSLSIPTIRAKIWFMATEANTSETPARRYQQFCPVARSLDVLGERWTLLIVRSLLMGPQRYTDLRHALPGIATDLLTARLRTLEQAGYVERHELPRPARVTVYQLTDSGRQLGRVVLELARTGLERLGSPAEDEPIDTDALVLSLRASYSPDAARQGERYQLELDGEPYAVTIDADRAQTALGQAPDPVLTISTTSRTLAKLLSGAADPDKAIAAGEVRVDRPQPALDRFLNTFAYPARQQRTPRHAGQPR
jgi:DNA-binding HxlR family transcriptional regulator